MKRVLFFIFIVGLLLAFQVPAFAQEKGSLDQQIEILNFKLEIVRLKKGVYLERVKLSMFFTQLRLEEAGLVDEIGKLTKLQEKQEADKKAEEEKKAKEVNEGKEGEKIEK